MRAVLLISFLLLTGAELAQAQPGFGQLFHDGDIVGTVVPPAAMPQVGRDDLYVVMDGAEGQLAIAAVAPGDIGYHGGKWAFHAVFWNVEPYLITSELEVFMATLLGDVEVIRVVENDFKCPIQP